SIWHQSNQPANSVRDLGDQAIEQELHLQPKSNTIKILAWNEGALKDYQEFESTSLVFLVDFQKQVKSPDISLSFSPAGANQEVALEVEKPEVVDVPTIRLHGRFDSTKSREDLDLVKKDEIVPDGFMPGKLKLFEFTETLKLTPGVRHVQLFAKTPNSAPAGRDFQIDYRPQLPTLKLLTRFDGLIRRKGEDPEHFDLKWTLTEPSDPQPYEQEVWINGVKQDRLDSAKKPTYISRLPLKPGDNAIEIRLSNQWGRRSSVAGRIRYLRPPRIVEFAKPEVR